MAANYWTRMLGFDPLDEPAEVLPTSLTSPPDPPLTAPVTRCAVEPCTTTSFVATALPPTADDVERCEEWLEQYEVRMAAKRVAMGERERVQLQRDAVEIERHQRYQAQCLHDESQAMAEVARREQQSREEAALQTEEHAKAMRQNEALAHLSPRSKQEWLLDEAALEQQTMELARHEQRISSLTATMRKNVAVYEERLAKDREVELQARREEEERVAAAELARQQDRCEMEAREGAMREALVRKEAAEWAKLGEDATSELESATNAQRHRVLCTADADVQRHASLMNIPDRTVMLDELEELRLLQDRFSAVKQRLTHKVK